MALTPSRQPIFLPCARLRGSNLTDTEARPHPSFLKELAPLPGRSLTAGVRLAF